ncbi:MAG TPA: RNA-binding S4 domain-containing protein [Candidatus Limnocylindria bacterium]|nr:RNA-binding S4 domain-containing protein [Candidatus Limnocylindria bacterium]
MRLDQWLWAVRLYRTRTLAAGAIKSGLVKVGEAESKPAHEVKPGEIIVAKTGDIIRTYKVIGAPAARVGAKLVPTYAEDLTPPEVYRRERDPLLAPPAERARGSGRPTKRDRRLIGRLEF